MEKDTDYGHMTKRIVFTENDHRHAQLVLKLKYLRITQAAFFRHIITGLIGDDPRIIEYANEISFRSKRKKVKNPKSCKKLVAKNYKILDFRKMM